MEQKAWLSRRLTIMAATRKGWERRGNSVHKTVDKPLVVYLFQLLKFPELPEIPLPAREPRL